MAGITHEKVEASSIFSATRGQDRWSTLRLIQIHGKVSTYWIEKHDAESTHLIKWIEKHDAESTHLIKWIELDLLYVRAGYYMDYGWTPAGILLFNPFL